MSTLIRQFNEFSAWRATVKHALADYENWLESRDLQSPGIVSSLSRAVDRLSNERLTVAFVAEFSRGKTELINAIFFAEYGQRILPSAAGPTTMCPTELRWDPEQTPAIRLLPIETRASSESFQALRDEPDAWTVIPVDVKSTEQMLEAMSRVAETKRVRVETARSLGLFNPDDIEQQSQLGDDGLIEISCWRHAVVNIPHPLLQRGLVVIDTPGLNAIGSEPELTLNLIPNADAVLFVLAADTGVTRSDLDIWHQHIGGATRHGRLVVLNKIDTMWDELKSLDEIDAEINRQIDESAHRLGIDRDQMFAVSAHKGLVGKIQRDALMLEKSGLIELEDALSTRLVPQRQRIVAEQLANDVESVMREIHGLLVNRGRGVVEQLHELDSVRGKNTSTVERMLERIEAEKAEFEGTTKQLVATRSVFTRLSNEVYRLLGTDLMRAQLADTRNAMGNSRFSPGLRSAMREYLDIQIANLDEAEARTNDLYELMAAMYKRFQVEHGMTLPPAQPLRLRASREEIDKVGNRFEQEFSTLKILTSDHTVLVQKFYESVAARVKSTFGKANKDVDAWLKSLMSPIEMQTREHQKQLRRRLEAIKRVYEASDELDTRIGDLRSQQSSADELSTAHSALTAQMRAQIFALGVVPVQTHDEAARVAA
ncbi:dynamin-like GTPase family protein [soil metagenome]